MRLMLALAQALSISRIFFLPRGCFHRTNATGHARQSCFKVPLG
ncbi:hypothetical protein EV14_3002 [Prochlorococcus sp. MIT 0703]|nr:hypothetical protein EV12_3116 [Prochlorococcus sp. MIT 0701]KGG30069.1 hypothetical protein EV14_3002 [Prochlorococcus sp. MIT 0703]